MSPEEDLSPEEMALDLVGTLSLKEWSDAALTRMLKALREQTDGLRRFAKNGRSAQESQANPYHWMKLNEVLPTEHAAQFQALLVGADRKGCYNPVIRALRRKFEIELGIRAGRRRSKSYASL